MLNTLRSEIDSSTCISPGARNPCLGAIFGRKKFPTVR